MQQVTLPEELLVLVGRCSLAKDLDRNLLAGRYLRSFEDQTESAGCDEAVNCPATEGLPEIETSLRWGRHAAAPSSARGARSGLLGGS
jgi:hypothetical protein